MLCRIFPSPEKCFLLPHGTFIDARDSFRHPHIPKMLLPVPKVVPLLCLLPPCLPPCLFLMLPARLFPTASFPPPFSPCLLSLAYSPCPLPLYSFPLTSFLTLLPSSPLLLPHSSCLHPPATYPFPLLTVSFPLPPPPCLLP